MPHPEGGGEGSGKDGRGGGEEKCLDP
jgi:hypothetical protein